MGEVQYVYDSQNAVETVTAKQLQQQTTNASHTHTHTLPITIIRNPRDYFPPNTIVT